MGEIVNKAGYPNHVWSYDFVVDRTERGGKLRILVMIDEYTRECLTIRVVPSSLVKICSYIVEMQSMVTQGSSPRHTSRCGKFGGMNTTIPS